MGAFVPGGRTKKLLKSSGNYLTTAGKCRYNQGRDAGTTTLTGDAKMITTVGSEIAVGTIFVLHRPTTSLRHVVTRVWTLNGQPVVSYMRINAKGQAFGRQHIIHRGHLEG